jgi:hypothetical protein
MGTWSKCLLGSDTAYDVAGRADQLLRTCSGFGELPKDEDGEWRRMHCPDDWTEEEQKILAQLINEYGLDCFIDNNMLRDCDGDPNLPYNNIAGPIVGLFVISSGAKMTDEQKIAFIMAAHNDSWSKTDEERKEIMQSFARSIHDYKGEPIVIDQEGLMDKMGELLD